MTSMGPSNPIAFSGMPITFGSGVSTIMDRSQAACAVVERACENHANGFGAPILSDRAEQRDTACLDPV